VHVVGKLNWLIPGGRLPLASTGPEPAFTSHERLAILNASDGAAEIRITVFYEDAPPVRGYELVVDARRSKKVRINELIDPWPLRLGRSYACLLTSSVPVVVQFSGLDSGHRARARMGTIAFPVG
jgi:hypothetical protein